MLRPSLLWCLAFILLVTLVIQFARWKRTTAAKNDLARVATVHIRTEHQKRLKQVSDAQEKRRRLEQQFLWREPERLLPALGEISDRLSLSLVGLDELSERRHGNYGSVPLQLTFSGNHSGFSTFLSVVERIVPAVRIEEMRLYQPKRRADTLRLSLTLAPIHKVEKHHVSSVTTIELPAIERSSVISNPFQFTARSPPRVNVPESSLPQLTGTLWSDVNPIAILDRQSARVGEVIAGATILSIQPQRVVVQRGTQRYELELWKKQY